MNEPTSQDLAPRIERAQNEVKTAEAALSAALQAHRSAVVHGESELNQARARKAVDDARATLAEVQEREKMLRDELQAATAREAEAEHLSKRRATDRRLRVRTANFKRLDRLLVEVATLTREIMRQGADIAAGLPKRLDWTPTMFTRSGLTQRIGLRLLAASEGDLRMGSNMSTPWEAAQMPALAIRAAEERTSILEQLGYEPEQQPSTVSGEAARS